MKTSNPIVPDGSVTAGPYSPGVRAGDHVFVSGQIAYGEGLQEDIGGQTVRALENVAAVLAAGGLGLEDVIKTTVFLDPSADFAAYNAVYATYFPTEPPARTTVRSELTTLIPGLLIEIEAIAYDGRVS